MSLEPLSEQDILTIAYDKVSDARLFVKEARRRGIYELLTNPQTLDLIMTVVHTGDWPHTRLELYESACRILVKEREEHNRALPADVNIDMMLSAAGYLSAVILCGGSEGFALTEKSADQSFPFIGELPGKQDELSLAARRRIFRADGFERVVPTHRTIAEFVAARYLVTRIREGLPIGRVIALVTGNDGGTLSDLRGLFAWLACQCPEHVESLIPRDPFGVVLYGDPAQLSLSAKKLVIKNLVDLAQRNPWFRSAENWASRPLGGLASEDMELAFRKIIEDSSQHPVAVSCVLDAIRYGTPLPRLGDLLLNVVRDKTRRDYLRVNGLRAFIHACPDRMKDLEQLLNDINNGRVKDDDNGLLGNLLHTLYPLVIGVPQIVDYLIPEHSNIYSDYNRFLDTYLVKKTDLQQIPVLLDAVVGANFLRSSEECYSCKRFVGDLLVAGLADHGEAVSVNRLYTWIMLIAGEYGEILIEREKSQEVIDWLKTRPTIVAQLFFNLIMVSPPERVEHEEYRFSYALTGVKYPEDITRRMLEQAAIESNSLKAEFLLKKAIRINYRSDQDVTQAVEEIHAFVDRHPQFRNLSESLLIARLSTDHIEHQIQHIEDERQRLEKRATLIENIKTKMDDIRSGEDISSLVFLANIYFGRYVEIDRDLPPEARLIAFVGDELASAAKEGFGYIVRKKPVYTPSQIGELHADSSRHYTYGIVILAAMDLFASNSIDDLLTLADEILRSAIAYHYASSTGGEREWVTRIMVERPALAVEALGAFWKPHFAKDAADIPGLYSLAHDDKMKDVGRLLSPLLLSEYPCCTEQNLRHLMRVALNHVDQSLLLKLVDDVLSRAGLVSGVQRIYWLATGYLLNADKFKKKLAKYVNRNKDKAAHFLNYISQIGLERLKKRPLDLTLPISIAGSVFPHYRGNESEWVRDINAEEERSRSIDGLLTVLGNDISQAAVNTLNELYNNPALSSWKESIARARASQMQQRRETEFQFPTVAKVISTLQGGQPSNSADLQALLVDHLNAISEELRHGPTDGYKAFWNVDPHDKPTKPRPENDCRDRLLEIIRPRLSRVGVNAEPEGHYAQDKRADIKALFGSMNVPIEIKRHYHPDLWTAPVEQLQKLYVRDPGTQGRGIYLVFWFGTKEKNIRKPPMGISQPVTPSELQNALLTVIPEDDRVLIEVIILDCSSSIVSPNSLKKSKKKRKHRHKTS
ncbi:MAG: hypothetical protein M0042_04795 [Nitrospiraceae bacterium]|nr:hypothetical protein [Nitrospiraceae bacterium]